MKSTCPRIDQAEARLDGRLDAEADADFLRHASGCSACASEVAALEALRQRMLAVPAFEAAPRDVRAERDALVARVETGASASSAKRHAWLMFAAGALTIVAFFTERVLTRTTNDANLPAAPSASVPGFDVASVEGAVWQSRVDGSTVYGTLSAGTASFHVEHLVSGQRFLLKLPDGELEVRGTRFTVRVRDGATEQVNVTEGVVALRLRDRTEIVLRAGDRWPADAVPPVLSAVQPPSTPAGPSRGATTNAPARAGAPTATVAVAGAASTAGAVSSSPADERFASAVTAFRAGSYNRADVLFADFQREFTRDPRAEDAAFLRAVARERSGDHTGAAQRAREYLRIYPTGLRKAEAERLASPR